MARVITLSDLYHENVLAGGARAEVCKSAFRKIKQSPNMIASNVSQNYNWKHYRDKSMSCGTLQQVNADLFRMCPTQGGRIRA